MTPLAMTMGEPAGVGAGLAAAAWATLKAGARPFYLVADPAWAASGGAPIVEIARPEDAASAFARALPVLVEPLAAAPRPGRLSPENAAAVIRSIERAVAQAQSGAAAGVVTLPIHKKALYDGAGFAHPGHTEFLAALAGVERTVMLLAADELRVAPVTIHIALAQAPAALSSALIEATIRILAADLSRWFGVASPRIAVAGLNPHAGEGGSFGREEIEIIAPTLERLRAEGFQLDGPRSADTMFHAAARAGYDAAVAMYHDQALIPIKTLAFDRGVNVTLGLPFIRTSPDHGPALDRALAGLPADPTSLIEALRLADRMAARRSDARA